MGAPAKLVRACSAADLVMIRQAAEHYRARSARYRTLLRTHAS
jgi:carbonic anhydrase/acetyltransferase-like protein (isoleucine patch superfamily)